MRTTIAWHNVHLERTKQWHSTAQHSWRFATLGVALDMSMPETFRISQAAQHTRRRVWWIADGAGQEKRRSEVHKDSRHPSFAEI